MNDVGCTVHHHLNVVIVPVDIVYTSPKYSIQRGDDDVVAVGCGDTPFNADAGGGVLSVAVTSTASAASALA